MLAFTSVYFFESRLFNGLQAIQIKNSLLRLGLTFWLYLGSPLFPFHQTLAAQEIFTAS